MKRIIKYIVPLLALALYTYTAEAQVKIGSNPTTPSATSNLEVEAANGNKTVVQKNNGDVGIGTATPGAKLHVAGNQILGTAVSLTSSAGTSQVVRDNATGELKVLQAPANSKALITTVTYNINNVNKDWISNFDTKISTTDYSMVIVGVVFNSPTNILTVGPGGGALSPGYNPLNFQATASGGTWHLSVDYLGGGTSNGGNGSYIIQCLVINNSITQSLSQTVNLGGSNTGAAPSVPAGL